MLNLPLRLRDGTEHNRSLFVGVDCGQPRAFAKICDETGRVLSDCYCVGPLNPYANWDAVVDTIHGAVINAIKLKPKDLEPGQVVGIVVGMPGMEDEGGRNSLAKLIQQKWIFGDLYTTVVPDMNLIMDEIAPHGPGLLLSSGPNDREFARDASGHYYRADGSGFGQRLALKAIDAVLDAGSQHGAPTTLLPRFINHFRVDDKSDLVSEFDFYNEAERSKTLNDILSIIADEAQFGDRIANELCSVAAFRYAELANTMIGQLKIEQESIPIGLIGDVWAINDPIKKPFMTQVKKVAPRAYLVETSVDVAESAANLAIDLYGSILDWNL